MKNEKWNSKKKIWKCFINNVNGKCRGVGCTNLLLLKKNKKGIDFSIPKWYYNNVR